MKLLLLVVAFCALAFGGHHHRRNVPAVSVIIPTYQRQDLLLNTVARILTTETLKNVQVVIIDDSSQCIDAAAFAPILSSNPKLADSIYYECFEGQRFTIGEKRNMAIRRATAPVIAFWDDDDIFGPKRLEQQLEKLRAQKGGIVAVMWDKILDVESGQLYQVKERGMIGAHYGTLMFDRSIFDQKKLVFGNVSYAEDVAFVQAAQKAREIFGLDNSEWIYVKHATNSWEDLKIENIRDKLEPVSLPEWLRPAEVKFLQATSAKAAESATDRRVLNRYAVDGVLLPRQGGLGYTPAPPGATPSPPGLVCESVTWRDVGAGTATLPPGVTATLDQFTFGTGIIGPAHLQAAPGVACPDDTVVRIGDVASNSNNDVQWTNGVVGCLEFNVPVSGEATVKDLDGVGLDQLGVFAFNGGSQVAAVNADTGSLASLVSLSHPIAAGSVGAFTSNIGVTPTGVATARATQSPNLECDDTSGHATFTFAGEYTQLCVLYGDSSGGTGPSRLSSIGPATVCITV